MKRFLLVVNGLTLLPLLLADSAYVIPPTEWWVPNFMAYFITYWLWIPLIWIALWLLIDFRIALLNLLLFFANIPNLSANYQFSAPSAVHERSLKVISLNLNALSYRVTFLEHLIDSVRAWNADILCFQEYPERHYFGHTFVEELPSKQIKKVGNYRYFYFVELMPTGFGLAIFSRYPIINKGSVTPTHVPVHNGIIFADIRLYGEVVRVYNVHLQSYSFSVKERTALKNGRLQPQGKGYLRLLRHIVQRWKIQYTQWLRLKFHRTTAKTPKYTIVCSDLNNPPSSYFYWQFRRYWQDAFVEKGWGRGFTYHLGPLKYRIDFIFAGKGFYVERYRSFPVPFSDHHAVEALLRFDFH